MLYDGMGIIGGRNNRICCMMVWALWLVVTKHLQMSDIRIIVGWTFFAVVGQVLINVVTKYL
jgi:hypothetical protein